MLFSQQPLHVTRADELRQSPPKGTPYSVALPGTEKPGRSKVYRAWNATEGVLKSLDPQVCLPSHDFRRSAIVPQYALPCWTWV